MFFKVFFWWIFSGHLVPTIGFFSVLYCFGNGSQFLICFNFKEKTMDIIDQKRKVQWMLPLWVLHG